MKCLDNMQDIEFCERVAAHWRDDPKSVIRVKCFNQEEADWVEGYLKKVHPEVRFFVVWNEWAEGGTSREKDSDSF